MTISLATGSKSRGEEQPGEMQGCTQGSGRQQEESSAAGGPLAGPACSASPWAAGAGSPGGLPETPRSQGWLQEDSPSWKSQTLMFHFAQILLPK